MMKTSIERISRSIRITSAEVLRCEEQTSSDEQIVVSLARHLIQEFGPSRGRQEFAPHHVVRFTGCR
jgi:hypothetical protein